MRLINSIWDKLLSSKKYESGKLTYMEMDSNNYDRLVDEFQQEFECSEVDISDLEQYFNLKISISIKKGVRFV